MEEVERRRALLDQYAETVVAHEAAITRLRDAVVRLESLARSEVGDYSRWNRRFGNQGEALDEH